MSLSKQEAIEALGLARRCVECRKLLPSDEGFPCQTCGGPICTDCLAFHGAMCVQRPEPELEE